MKILSIVDEHTREYWGGVVDYSITGLDLAEQFDVLVIDHVIPQALQMDNGPEFTSNVVAEWAGETARVFLPPGQPWQNGYFGPFKGELGDESISASQFYSLNHARGIIAIWKGKYNTSRPHSSFGCSTKSFYAGQCTHQKPVTTPEATEPKKGGGPPHTICYPRRVLAPQRFAFPNL